MHNYKRNTAKKHPADGKMLKINFLRRHYPYQVHGSKRNTLYLSRIIVQHPVAASADKYI